MIIIWDSCPSGISPSGEIPDGQLSQNFYHTSRYDRFVLLNIYTVILSPSPKFRSSPEAATLFYPRYLTFRQEVVQAIDNKELSLDIYTDHMYISRSARELKLKSTKKTVQWIITERQTARALQSTELFRRSIPLSMFANPRAVHFSCVANLCKFMFHGFTVVEWLDFKQQSARILAGPQRERMIDAEFVTI